MSNGSLWLKALVSALLLSLPASLQAQSQGVLREVWENIDGGSVSDLTSSPAYPDRPTSSNYVTELFEAPTDVLDNYGQRLHGYVVPPTTGDYTFWISSDDGGALYLSTDENPANARLVARVSSWTGPREWEKEPNQKSSAVSLVAGRPYYISALMKEGGGGDNLAVRWRMPDGTDQGPIAGTNLLPFGISFSPPQIAQHPADTTAVEGGVARFSVRLSTVGPAAYQWRRNGAALGAPSAPDLEIGPVRLSDSGARYSVVVTNRLGAVTSSEARLTVAPDVTPPSVVAVLNIGTGTLRVTFSEPVEAASATVPSNYSLSPAVNVVGAAVGPEARIVDLSLAGLTLGTRYTLTVTRVRDQAQTPNPIAAGGTIAFTAVQYAPATIGTPALTGQVQDAAGGADVAGAGSIGGTADAFQFAYQLVSGNFDRRVRVAAFPPTDPFAQAVLMARATLEADSAFAAAVTTPAQVGSYYLSRNARGAAALRSGWAPANPPDTWLRLARNGNTFTAYTSVDGQAWFELGRTTMSLPATLFVGFGSAGRDTTRVAAVQFREAGEGASGTVTVVRPVVRGETPGPSSRHTPLAISEIMYHPRERADGRNGEFIEIHNADLIDQELTGHRLSGSVNYRFPEGYVLPAGGYAVVARVPGDLAALSGLTGVLGPFEGTNNLPNGSGLVRLRNAQDATLLEVEYEAEAPWPVAADGAGHSLVLLRPSYGEKDARAWAASARVGGSPGAADPGVITGAAPILINEVLAHTDLPQLDLIELYNRGNEPVDLSGWFLTDDPATNRYRIPDGTVITPRGFIAVDETRLGFRLDAAGESVFLVHSNRTHVVDAVRFGGQENGVSTGRFPDGSPEWRRLGSVTPAAENAPFRVSDVVLNEILFAPISDDDRDEFVEVYNRSAAPKDLSGWSLSDGVQFRFPAGTILPAGGYLVVAKDRARLMTNNPALSAGLVLGDYEGTLSNGGERLALAMPDLIVTTNAFGLSETNRIDIEVDEVTYGTGGQWGRWSDGGGSSLELIDPESDHLRPSSWADSDESAKAPWSTIEFTGPVDNVASGTSSDRIHLLAQGAGEYLIDDIEVQGADGSSRLANGSFDAGSTGWTWQGNHRGTRLDETGGMNGTRALRIVTTGRGDTAVNRVRANLSPVLASSQNATLRAKVRWIAGWPEFLLRTRGSGIEAYGRLETPRSAGTPGARNSRAASNAGPAIAAVSHAPVLPRDREPVVVSARVTDPDGIASVTLRYRLDPAATLQNLAMRDDGTSGDAVAGDGVYSATLSNRTAGTLVAFRIEAVDQAAEPATGIFPRGAPQKEGLIRWGEERVFGNLGVYRLWQRKADYDRLRSREPLANDNLDCTFVYGDERVVYNAEMRGKGSPWHGGSVGADYIVTMPDDQRVLGARDFAIVTLGNLGSDPSAQREQAAFWIGRQLGVAALHRRHVQFFENGGFKGLYEDTEEPNGLYVDAMFPEGENGDLFKIEDWFEFDDAGSSFIAQRDATLQRFTSGGQLKLARYRWSWRKRAVQDSANDYREFMAMVSAVNASGSTFVPQVEGLVDVDDWMRVFALQHIVGNWDAYGYNRGKNCYLYLPSGGRWKMIPWDIDFVLGSNSDPSNADVFSTNDPTVSKLWNTPAFRRIYWRAFLDAINGPLREERIGPILDARYSALVANGFTTLEGTDAIKRYVRERRQYLANGLSALDVADLAITSNNGANFTSSSNLVAIAGRAPIAAASITVNGVVFPVNWTDVTAWSINVPLAASTNVLQFAALDRLGRPLAGLGDTVTVRYTGVLPQPQDLVVINEIQFDPAVKGGAFVEVHNTSATASFDLTGWRLEGAAFTFPSGTVLRPNGYLVVAADLVAFRNAYGASVVPIGVFDGNLQNDGERLRLVRPGGTPAQDLVIDDLRYDSELPWPVVTRGQGPSLQLIDPLQDNRRPANWAAEAVDAGLLATPGTANSKRATLEAFPALWLNEVLPVNTDGLRDRAGDRDPWVEIHNASDATVDLSGIYLSSSVSNLTAWAFPAGTSLAARQFLVVWCDGEPGESAAGELHTSFRLEATNGSVTLSRNQGGAVVALDHLRYCDVPSGKAWGSFPDGQPMDRALFHLPTPGAANRLGAPSLPVFINEWMASNAGLVLDPADGDADDWFELYNAGGTPADLSAFTLTDDPADPKQFVIPNGIVIPPGGYLLVWADNEPQQTRAGQLHVNFRLSGSGDFVGLFAPDGQAVDGISFGVQTATESQGRFPDGGDEPFLFMPVPTPASANVVATANQPPVLATIGAKSIDEGARLAFKATATDADAGQSLRFELLAAPAGAQIDAVTGDFSWTPGEADGPAEVSITVRVTDNGVPARADAETLVVTVREVNQAPTLEPIADRTANEGEPLVFSAIARDADLPAQALVYTLDSGSPTGASIDAVSGEFRWTPEEAQGPGVYTLVVRVTDGATPALSASRSFRVTVNEVNNAPEIDPVPLQTVEESVRLQVQVVARDPDTPAVALQYLLESGPSGASLEAGTGVFRWTPSEADGPGSYSVTVRVREGDAGPSGTMSFSVVVSEKNEAPELAAIADRNEAEGALVTFTAQAQDVDRPAQKLTYRLEPGAPEGAAIHPDTGAFTWAIPADGGGGTFPITVTVTDNDVAPRSASRTFTVRVEARVRVVIHEIQYAAPAANAEFVELFNASTATSWSIGGWRLRGFDYTLPEGTILGATQHLVVARNMAAFRAEHGSAARAVGDATLGLTASGPQRIRLERPTSDGGWETIDEVSFEREAPWPLAANGRGASLQLIDAAQDNRRVGNWAATAGAAALAPQSVVAMTNEWRYFQTGAAPAGWTNRTFNDAAWPSGRALLVVEDATLAAPKNTALTRTEGRMTYYFRTRFNFNGVAEGATLRLSHFVDDGVVLYLNGREIHRLGIPAGAVSDATAADRTVSDAALEGPFEFPATGLLAGENVLAAEVHQVNATSSDIVWGASLEVVEVRRESSTPGYANSVRATLAPFPEVWLSEVLPQNTSGPTDDAGEREPWIELWNAGSTVVDVGGLYLTDDLAQPTRWAFPNPWNLGAGTYALVWADGESSESTSGVLHTSFRLASATGVVALVRQQGGAAAVVDYLRYTGAGADQSFGVASAADPLARGPLPRPTPGASNASNSAPVLETIADREGTAGSLLAFEVRASDPDVGQQLSYALAAGSPAGASIHPSSGRFEWTPTVAQVGTHAFTVLVSDNGDPALGAQRSFTVVIRPGVAVEVRLTRIAVGAAGVTLEWTSLAGRRYQVEETKRVTGPWNPAGAVVTAAGAVTSATLPVTEEARFYRVLEVP